MINEGQPRPGGGYGGPPRTRAPRIFLRDQLLRRMFDLYPRAFDARRPKPLAVGIHDGLAERLGVPRRDVREALLRWSRTTAYLKATVAGADRIDLYGRPRGVVTAEEEARAKAILAARPPRPRKPKPPRKPDEKAAKDKPAAPAEMPAKPAPRKAFRSAPAVEVVVKRRHNPTGKKGLEPRI